MRTYKKETRVVENTILTKLCCDLCGKEAIKQSWSGGFYELNETEVEVTVHQKEGNSFPEGGWGTEITIDLCPDCFKDELVPFLRSKGAKIEVKEWEW